MFHKKKLEVKLVKDNKSESVASTSLDKVELVASHIGYTINRVVKTVGVMAIGYVVVDTFRQVLVAQARNPID